MKKLLLILIMLVWVEVSAASAVEVHYITRNEAIDIVKRQFVGRDVDIYIENNQLASGHRFFVDAEPMKGWEHECYIVYVASRFRLDSGVTLENYQPIITELRLPPEGDYRPLEVKNRYGEAAAQKPLVAQRPALLPAYPNKYAENTYAIILSGGYCPTSNYERYWNDCSFIYQTLKNRYYIPKKNIYPMMADGLNPAADMITTKGELVSQSLDLDFDGLNEISLSATKSNLELMMNTFAGSLNENDHLFIYVIDHGTLSDDGKTSYICLWNRTLISDTEFVDLINPLLEKSVNVSVVLGQCHSGGFVEHLKKKGCVVATASTQKEYSWSCMDKPYDEFVYHWTSAMNWADHQNRPINADTNGDGIVSMDEAFKYAQSNDRMRETPQYASTPISIGADLAFNNINEPFDLYIKDNCEDTGMEPNITTELFWKSPSIWVRNKDDGIEEHENGYFSNYHPIVYVYVKIHNRGKCDYDKKKDPRYVHLFWAKASTAICEATWKGKEVDEENEVTGFTLGPCLIPDIAAGDSAIVKYLWVNQGPSQVEQGKMVNRCLFAMINKSPAQDLTVVGDGYIDVLGRKTQAQKNVTIIEQTFDEEGHILVGNLADSVQIFNLKVIYGKNKEMFFARNNRMEVELNSNLVNAWRAGGMTGHNITMIAPRNAPQDGLGVAFNNPDSKMTNIVLAPRQYEKIKVKFVFNDVPETDEPYTIDLVQRDVNGKIVGGETFIVVPPTASGSPLSINVAETGCGQALLSLDSEDFRAVRWYDSEMNLISENASISVDVPRKADAAYSAVAINDEGELAKDSTILTAKSGISKVYVGNDSEIVVELKNSALRNSSIVLYDMNNNVVVRSKDLLEKTSECQFDVRDVMSGIYTVSYFESGELIDSVKFVI